MNGVENRFARRQAGTGCCPVWSIYTPRRPPPPTPLLPPKSVPYDTRHKGKKKLKKKTFRFDSIRYPGWFGSIRYGSIRYPFGSVCFCYDTNVAFIIIVVAAVRSDSSTDCLSLPGACTHARTHTHGTREQGARGRKAWIEEGARTGPDACNHGRRQK